MQRRHACVHTCPHTCLYTCLHSCHADAQLKLGLTEARTANAKHAEIVERQQAEAAEHEVDHHDEESLGYLMKAAEDCGLSSNNISEHADGERRGRVSV